jgi:hypothetical protein
VGGRPRGVLALLHVTRGSRKREKALTQVERRLALVMDLAPPKIATGLTSPVPHPDGSRTATAARRRPSDPRALGARHRAKIKKYSQGDARPLPPTV